MRCEKAPQVVLAWGNDASDKDDDDGADANCGEQAYGADFTDHRTSLRPLLILFVKVVVAKYQLDCCYAADIYIMMQCLCVYHEKSSLPTSELSGRGAKWAAR